MELEFSTVDFKCIIKSEVVIFLSFTKNKETKCLSVKLTKNFKKVCHFTVKSMKIKNICNIRELQKNPQNPLQKRMVFL